MIEKFATNCCLYSVLDKSFDLRDANSVRHVTLLLLKLAILTLSVLMKRDPQMAVYPLYLAPFES